MSALSEPRSAHQDLLKVLWRHRWIAAGTFVFCVAATVLYLVRATPVYTSSSRLTVEQSGPMIIAGGEKILTQSKGYLFTQAELLRSTPILTGAMSSLEGSELATFDDCRDRITMLKKGLEVSVGKKDDIITISLDSPYPQEAARIVNAVVESYVAYNSSQQRNTAAEILGILQREKVKSDSELRERFRAVMEFKRDNETISFGSDDSNIIIQRLIKLSDALTAAELEMMDARARFESARQAANEPARLRRLVEAQLASAGKGAEALSGLQLQIDKVELELTTLLQDCSEEHPAVIAAHARLQQLSGQREARLGELAKGQLVALEQGFDAASTRVNELKNSLGEQRTLAQDLNSQAVEHAILQADLQRTERLCDLLDSRIKEIDITDDAGGMNICILEPAQAPELASHPNKPRVLAMSMVLGVFLGFGAALLRNWLDHRLRSIEEISEVLGLPVLGAVPHMQDVKKPEAVGRIVEFDPSSQMAEAYRAIRTALYFGGGKGRIKTVLVTSPAPSDGKSTSCSNLAIAMAQAGQKVLLVDADLRRPSQQYIWQIDVDARGLTDVLSGHQTLTSAIRTTSVAKLDVLPCGTVPPNPSEVLNSQAFSDVLDELSGMYDYVLLDAPPVMPVTDAHILGAMADATVLVLRADVSSRRPSRQAVETLLKVGTQIIGTVVNDVPTGKGNYGYYYGNHYYGYARSEQGERKMKAAS